MLPLLSQALVMISESGTADFRKLIGILDNMIHNHEPAKTGASIEYRAITLNCNMAHVLDWTEVFPVSSLGVTGLVNHRVHLLP